MNRTLPLAAALASAVLLAGCGSDEPNTTTTTDSSTSTTTSEPDTDADSDSDATGGEVEPQPFNASGLMGGDANPNLPDGEAGKVSVVAQAPIEKSDGMGSATLSFAFRNNTDEAISHVDWSATARDGDELVATGSSQGSVPAQIAPGEIGMAYIYFEAGKSIPDTGATYEFTAETSPADTDSFNTAPITVTEANRSGNTVVGTATNATGATATGPYSVWVYCFDGDNLTGHDSDFAEEDGDVAPDGDVHFTVDIYTKPCPTYAIGVSGYFS